MIYCSKCGKDAKNVYREERFDWYDWKDNFETDEMLGYCDKCGIEFSDGEKIYFVNSQN